MLVKKYTILSIKFLRNNIFFIFSNIFGITFNVFSVGCMGYKNWKKKKTEVFVQLLLFGISKAFEQNLLIFYIKLEGFFLFTFFRFLQLNTLHNSNFQLKFIKFVEKVNYNGCRKKI
jgi:hypothetical protein